VTAIDTPTPATEAAAVDAARPEADPRFARMEAQLELLVAEARRRDAELEPLRDLAAEVGVLAGPVMDSVTDRVAVLEERGYLRFARSSAGVLDRVVTAFDEDDVEALGDNVVLILETLKGLTQPEIMHLLQRTASAAQEQAHEPPTGPPPSTFALLGQLRDPEVRRGLGRMLDLLRSVGTDRPT
jgi:uncharacterized protein YjgD (DUF1641 family)